MNILHHLRNFGIHLLDLYLRTELLEIDDDELAMGCSYGGLGLKTGVGSDLASRGLKSGDRGCQSTTLHELRGKELEQSKVVEDIVEDSPRRRRHRR